MDYKDLAIKWFNKANNDLIAGKYILTMPDPPADIICFHSQQSVEKYLKGFLAFYKLEIPRTHELEELISRCEEIDSLIFMILKAQRWLGQAKNKPKSSIIIPIMHKQVHLPKRGTRMTRIGRIFTDPCASASSAQSVFYCTLPGFICVHPQLIKSIFQQPASHKFEIMNIEEEGIEIYTNPS